MKDFMRFFSSSFVLLSMMLLSVQGYKVVGSKHKKYKTISEKKKLFQRLDCKYTDSLHIMDESLCTIDIRQTDFYKANQLYLDDLTQKYSSFLHNNQKASVYIKWVSERIGYGVYASRPIKAGDFVAQYAGTLRLAKKENDNFDYAWGYRIRPEELMIDGKYEGNEMRFVNHVSDPNTMCMDIIGDDGILYLCYIAIKDIPKNHQLTVSYGQDYWTGRGIEPEAF